jgi:hypothetical protein
MSFESPIQPVVGRGRSIGPILAALAVLLVGLVAAHPWGSPEPPPPAGSPLPSPFAPQGQPVSGSGAGPTSPVASPSVIDTSAIYAHPPSADRFQATWSVVGVRALADGGFSISQESLEPRPTPRTGMEESATCDLGPQRDVAFLPADQLQLLGLVAPHAGHGSIRLTLLDGSFAPAFPVAITQPRGTDDLAVGLFGVGARTLWRFGAYRFYAIDDYGVGRYIYACVGG